MKPLEFEFLKNRYDHELERKEKLEASLAFPASILIVLGSLVVTMLRGFSYSKLQLTIPFGALLVVEAFAFLRCLWFFAHAYHGSKMIYERLPPLADLQKAWQQLIEYYEQDETEQMAGEADEDFVNNLRQRMIEAADLNGASNNAKQGCMHVGIVWLFVLLSATTVSAVPYAIDQVVVPSKVPVMHIDNF